MRDAAGRTDALHLKTRFKLFEPVPEALAPTEEYGHDHDVEVINLVVDEIFTDRRRASADADVETACCLPGNFHSLGWTGVEEVKGRPALHLN